MHQTELNFIERLSLTDHKPNWLKDYIKHLATKHTQLAYQILSEETVTKYDEDNSCLAKLEDLTVLRTIIYSLESERHIKEQELKRLTIESYSIKRAQKSLALANLCLSSLGVNVWSQDEISAHLTGKKELPFIQYEDKGNPPGSSDYQNRYAYTGVVS